MKLQEAKYTDRGMAWDISGKKERKVRSSGFGAANFFALYRVVLGELIR